MTIGSHQATKPPSAHRNRGSRRSGSLMPWGRSTLTRASAFRSLGNVPLLATPKRGLTSRGLAVCGSIRHLTAEWWAAGCREWPITETVLRLFTRGPRLNGLSRYGLARTGSCSSLTGCTSTTRTGCGQKQTVERLPFLQRSGKTMSKR